MGAAFDRANRLSEAKELYEDALKTAKTTKSKTRRREAFLCLGLIMAKLEDIEKSRSYFKKAFSIKASAGEEKTKAERYLKITCLIREDLREVC